MNYLVLCVLLAIFFAVATIVCFLSAKRNLTCKASVDYSNKDGSIINVPELYGCSLYYVKKPLLEVGSSVRVFYWSKIELMKRRENLYLFLRYNKINDLAKQNQLLRQGIVSPRRNTKKAVLKRAFASYQWIAEKEDGEPILVYAVPLDVKVGDEVFYEPLVLDSRIRVSEVV